MILVMDNGRVCEYNSPKVLLENSNSMFYGMAKNAELI
jgi:ABC-type multidrug transport system fused ATPase/permease subunit